MSACSIAALAGFLLLMQGLVGGLAQGTMASAAVDPFNILCISDENDGPQRQAPGKTRHGGRDLCATLCQLAAGTSPALPDAVSDITFPALREPGKAHLIPGNIPSAISRSFFAEARAPPLLSA